VVCSHALLRLSHSLLPDYAYALFCVYRRCVLHQSVSRQNGNSRNVHRRNEFLPIPYALHGLGKHHSHCPRLFIPQPAHVAKEKLRFENEFLGWSLTWTDNTVLELQPGTIMLFRTYSMEDSVGYGLVLDQFSGINLQKRTYANQFQWKGDSTWLLKGLFIRSLGSTKHQLIKQDSLIINLPITPEDFDPDIEYSIEAMTTKQLKAFIKEEEQRGSENIKYYYVKLYERYAMPFTLIILTRSHHSQ